MYNYMVKQLQNSKLQIQPLGILSDLLQVTTLVSSLFQVITLVFRETIYEQDQTMYNYIVSKLDILKLGKCIVVHRLILHLYRFSEDYSDYLEKIQH